MNIKVRGFFDKYSIHIVLVAMMLGLAISKDTFLTATNMINLLTAESARGLMALGVAFCIISKGIDLSLGSVIAVSSVVSASLAQQATAKAPFFAGPPQYPLLVPILAGLAAGTAFGVVNGLLIAYTRIPAFIATLGTMTVARGVAFIYTNAYPIPQLRSDFKFLGQGKILYIPFMIWVFVFFSLVAWVLLNKTWFGKNIYAIGGNDVAARVAGVNVERNLVLVYTWSSLTAAVAGILITARSGSGIATLGLGYELDAIAAATVGGVSHSGGIGRVGSIIAGILLLGVLNNGLLIWGISPYIQQIIKGCIIVGAVVFDMRKTKRN